MRPLAPAVLVLGVLGALLASPVARAVDLTGTWYVLIHYTDDTSGKPDQQRWDERVWRFERQGDALAWTEWPIVNFDDDTGRFVREGGHLSRALGAFEPNAAQRAEIQSGLEVNPRGKKTKRLRGSDGQGWSSGGSAGGASANILTYVETWSIGGGPEKPTFTRTDSLAGGGVESLDGKTIYTTELAQDGELRGRFERDGTRHGTFRMIPTGATTDAGRDGRAPNEKLRERLEAELRERLGKQPGEPVTPEELDRVLQDAGAAE